jgi:hypothetical protein
VATVLTLYVKLVSLHLVVTDHNIAETTRETEPQDWTLYASAEHMLFHISF